MSPRIISDTHASIRPMSWRTRISAPHRPERQAPADAAVVELESKLSQLQQRAENSAAEARRAGYDAGFAQARTEMEAELRPLLDAMAEQVTGFARTRSALLAEAEESLAALALAVARRVLHRELTIDPAAIEGIVAAALRSLRGHHVLRVRVHPRLEPYVRSSIGRDDLLGDSVEILADRTLANDGLMFETERGNLDASIETQLDEIRRGLTDRVGR